MSKFSGALQLAGLDDFITPSQQCIKPIQNLNKQPDSAITQKHINIEIDDQGLYAEIRADGTKEVLQEAKITLNDCLACSGCITSAEGVLVSQQSKDEFLSNVAKKDKFFVVSVAPQVIASLAAYFKLPILEMNQRIAALFQTLGVHQVVDITDARDISLLECGEEFTQALQTKSPQAAHGVSPILSSSCPGWICYAEKSQGEFILPFISKVKSPQQICGTLIKDIWAKTNELARDKVYHCALMPCFDKKLEASRDDFMTSGIRDVDCVLTSVEIVELLKEKNIDITHLPVDLKTRGCTPLFNFVMAKTLDEIQRDNQIRYIYATSGGGSGGYAEWMLRYASKKLYGIPLQPKDITWKSKTKRNQDFTQASLEMNGESVVNVAIANGFKNIQNIVRSVKGQKSGMHYVEVMACPSGCLNGGGQCRPVAPEKPKEFLQRVETAYYDVSENGSVKIRDPDENPLVFEVYRQLVRGGIGSAEAKRLFHTQYHAREPFQNQLTIQW